MKTKKIVALLAITLTAISLVGCSKDKVEDQLSKALKSGTVGLEISLDSLTGEGSVNVTTAGKLEVDDEDYFTNRYIPAEGYHTYTVGLTDSTWEETLSVYYIGILDESFVGTEVTAYSYQTLTPSLLDPTKYDRNDSILFQELEGGDVWKYTEADDMERFITAPGYNWQPTDDDNVTVASLDTDFTVEIPMGTYYHCYGVLTEKEWSDGTTYTLELFASYDYSDSGKIVTLYYGDEELRVYEERTSYTMMY